MRPLRLLVIAALALGVFVAASPAGAASSTPSPKFCAAAKKTTNDLENVHPSTKNAFNPSGFKKVSSDFSKLAKSASGKLKSDIKVMAGYFKALANISNPGDYAKYLVGNRSSLQKYEKSATNFGVALATCETVVTTTPTTG